MIQGGAEPIEQFRGVTACGEGKGWGCGWFCSAPQTFPFQ